MAVGYASRFITFYQCPFYVGDNGLYTCLECGDENVTSMLAHTEPDHCPGMHQRPIDPKQWDMDVTEFNHPQVLELSDHIKTLRAEWGRLWGALDEVEDEKPELASSIPGYDPSEL
jgi:hypothetical protein